MDCSILNLAKKISNNCGMSTASLMAAAMDAFDDAEAAAFNALSDGDLTFDERSVAACKAARNAAFNELRRLERMSSCC